MPALPRLINMLKMKVKCPRCGKIWTIQEGQPGILCDCHLICPDGEKVSDCNVTPVNFNGDLGWPVGLKTGAESGTDDPLHHTYYCSVHNKYYRKVPIWIDADWKGWFSKRALKKRRMSHGQY